MAEASAIACRASIPPGCAHFRGSRDEAPEGLNLSFLGGSSIQIQSGLSSNFSANSSNFSANRHSAQTDSRYIRRFRFIPPFLQSVAPALGGHGRLVMVCYISNTPASASTVMQTWNDSAPIYQQLADRLAVQLLDGSPPEGEALPSVRHLASQYLINPLTVTRALQALVDNELIESRRGVGMYVRSGARERLLKAKREQFLHTEWPQLRDKLRRLGLSAQDLNWEAT